MSESTIAPDGFVYLPAESPVEDQEPEVASKTKGHFTKRVSDLEHHVDELTDQALVRLDLLEDGVEALHAKIDAFSMEMAGLRKSMLSGDYKALKQEVMKLRQDLWRHREEHR